MRGLSPVRPKLGFDLPAEAARCCQRFLFGVIPLGGGAAEPAARGDPTRGVATLLEEEARPLVLHLLGHLEPFLSLSDKYIVSD